MKTGKISEQKRDQPHRKTSKFSDTNPTCRLLELAFSHPTLRTSASGRQVVFVDLRPKTSKIFSLNAGLYLPNVFHYKKHLVPICARTLCLDKWSVEKIDVLDV